MTYDILDMSRSNHHYYNVCDDSCDGGWNGHECVKSRTYQTRRGLHTRKPRFSNTIKSFIGGPPMSLKKLWSRQARAVQEAQLHKGLSEDRDNVLVTPRNRIINLRNWY